MYADNNFMADNPLVCILCLQPILGLVHIMEQCAEDEGQDLCVHKKSSKM
jgi:hypothetical protein